ARTTTITLPDPDGTCAECTLLSPVIIQTTNNRGLLASVDDARRGITSYQYDGAGRQTRVTQPDPDGPNGPLAAPVTLYVYDGVGNVRFVTDPNQFVIAPNVNRTEY